METFDSKSFSSRIQFDKNPSKHPAREKLGKNPVRPLEQLVQVGGTERELGLENISVEPVCKNKLINK